jgi:chromosome segregation ATPase
VRADYETVQADLRRANELAAGLKGKLAGKSKEVTHLKFLVEQTRSNLAHLQDGIMAMRKERHDLANAAMRAVALDSQVRQLMVERDRLRLELEGVLQALTAQASEKSLRFDDRDARIANLTVQVVTLKNELADARRVSEYPIPPCEPGPKAKDSATETTNQDDGEAFRWGSVG